MIMTNLNALLANNFNNSDLYQIIQAEKLISFYRDGRKYFVFLYHGRIYYISEFKLAMILSSITFISIIIFRELAERFQLKKKTINLINRIRGGENIIDVSEIITYENPLTDVDPLFHNPFSINRFKTSNKNNLIKAMIRKCVKPNRIYRIVNPILFPIINKMVNYKKKNNIRVISYELFVLSLVVALKSSSIIEYQGLANLLKAIGVPALIEASPVISAVLAAMIFASKFNRKVGLPGVAFQFFMMILNSGATFESVNFLRTLYLIDCSDYLIELPQTNIDEFSPSSLNELPYLEVDSVSKTSLTISYTESAPTRHDLYVSTAPNTRLHCQEIDTLNGAANENKLIEWIKNSDSEKKCCVPVKYEPLKYNTKILKDVKQLDSTIDRESASEIINNVYNEQITASLLKESLNGE